VAFLKKEPKEVDPTVGGFDQLYSAFLHFYKNMEPGKKRTWVISSLIVALILILISSFAPLLLGSFISADIITWIAVLVGFPAGIIVFANCVIFIHFSRAKEWKLAQYKDTYPVSRRIRDAALTGVAVIAALIALGGAMPYGLGGTIVITLALFGYNLIRRTPEELRLAQLGLPDPRDFKEENNE
jgi:uncharacterized membrane protein (DUF485 family)